MFRVPIIDDRARAAPGGQAFDVPFDDSGGQAFTVPFDVPGAGQDGDAPDAAAQYEADLQDSLRGAAEEAKARDADAAFMRDLGLTMDHPDSGALSRQGRDASDYILGPGGDEAPLLRRTLAEAAASHAESLRSETARANFMRVATARIAEAEIRAAPHALGQTVKYVRASHHARRTGMRDEAVASFANTKLLDRNLNAAWGDLRRQGDQEGWSGDELDQSQVELVARLPHGRDHPIGRSRPGGGAGFLRIPARRHLGRDRGPHRDHARPHRGDQRP